MKKVFTLLYFLAFLFVACTPLDDDSAMDIPEVTVPEDPIPDPQGQPIPVYTAEVTPCEGGFAREYPCSNYNLVNRISLANLGTNFANDNWGWRLTSHSLSFVLLHSYRKT